MIKKVLFWLWFCVLWFLGFTNALFQYFPVWLDKTPSYWSSQYDVWILKRWRFLTNYLWTSRALVWLSDKFLIFWNNNWLYMYKWDVPSIGVVQWYFQYYQSCDEILLEWTWDALQNCSSGQQFIYNDDDISSNFISTLNSWDVVFVEDKFSTNGCWWYCTFHRYSLKVCFSSSSVWATLCFLWDKSDYENSSYRSKNPFTRSLWFTWRTNFSNINVSFLSDPPWFINSTIPDWDLANISCPTIQQVINNYNSKGFYSWLCYTFWKMYNWSTFEDVPVKSIFEVFSWKEDYLNWYEWYVTYCKSSVYNPAVCTDYFSWNSYKYNILAKIPDVSMVGWWKLLYTYCGLYDYDPNATTCVTQGTIPEVWTEITNNDIIDSIWHWEYTTISPVTNNTEYNTVFNMWSWYEYSWDIITNIQQLFWKFTSLFKQQLWNSSWILPLWILMPFIIIVLFKLFKK